jgi:hypothetical protein
MFYKTHTPDDRLQVWRELRNSARSQADILAEFAQIKPVSRIIDFYTPASWPSVFEIVREGYFCQSGITLVMAATLHNTGFINTDTILFPVISNHMNGNTGLVIQYQDQVFNFTPGEVMPVSVLTEMSTVYTLHTVPIKRLFS